MMNSRKQLLVIFILKLFLDVEVNSKCVKETRDECMKDENLEECKCPCLPKCCLDGYILIESDSPSLHGFECEKGKNEQKLPSINISGMLKNKHSVNASSAFYINSTAASGQGVFPSCEDLDKGWKYAHYTENFAVDADTDQKMILKINETEKNYTLTSTTFDDILYQEILTTSATKTRPMLHFCFDFLRTNGNLVTVALTCPRVDFTAKDFAKVHKCCPFGKAYRDSSLETCEDVTDQGKWQLPINGHMYNESFLENTGLLVYDKKHEAKASSDRYSKGCSAGLKLEQTEMFHITPQGNLAVNGGLTGDFLKNSQEDYCVEAMIPSSQNDDLGYVYEEYPEYDGNENGAADNNVQKDCLLASPPDTPVMRIFSCAPTHPQIPKCCNNTSVIDTRKGECVNATLHGMSARLNITQLEKLLKPGVVHRPPITSDDQIQNFPPGSKKYLGLRKFELQINGSLVMNFSDGTQATYDPAKNAASYCLDYVTNICSDDTKTWEKSGLIPIIVDPFHGEKRFSSDSHFGSDKVSEHSTASTIKRVGYVTSIIFLFITLAFIQFGEDNRKSGMELNRRIAICLVLSLLILYLDLTRKNFDLKGNDGDPNGSILCTVEAAGGLFFTLSAFFWMVVKSYHVMSRTRGQIVSSYKVGVRFAMYCAFGFGGALTSTLITLIFDKGVSPTSTPYLFKYRPGFAEESCWFTRCSWGLLVFFYTPIGLLIVTNLGLFIFTVRRLKRLRHAATIRDNKLKPNNEQSDDECGEESGRKMLHKQSSARVLLRKFTSFTDSLGQQWKQDKEALIVNGKLLVAMGLPWTLEILQGFHHRFDDKNNNSNFANFLFVLNNINAFMGPLVFLALIPSRTITRVFCSAYTRIFGRKDTAKSDSIAMGSMATGVTPMMASNSVSITQ